MEKYLTGHEYTVSLLGTGDSAKVLGSLQVNWSNPADGGFYTVSNKNEQGNEHLDQFVDAHNNPEVQAAEDLALRTWHALECCDVGRVDVRFGANGKPYVLELNPLPGLCPQWSSLVQTAEYHRISHEVLLGRIVESSLQRYPSLREKQSEKELRYQERVSLLYKSTSYSYNTLASRPRTRGNHPRSKGPRQTTKHHQVMCVSEMPSSRPLK